MATAYASVARGAAVTIKGTPQPSTVQALVAGTTSMNDVEDFGLYRIVATVKKKAMPVNAPLRRRVQLYRQPDGRLIREVWSNASTGEYSFNNIRGGDGTRYFVASFDHTHIDRAVIADDLEPKPMP